MIRGAIYEISVENPDGVEKGVRQTFVNGAETDAIPVKEPGTVTKVRVVMG